MDMVKQITDVVDISGYLPELKSIWQESTGESKITVAILDGPVDLSHPCFEGADLTLLETLIPRDANNALSSQHGTNVASIIFGQHGSLVPGISPGCRGLIVPVFSDGSDSSLSPCSQIDLAHAITQSLEYGANVIKISSGEIDASGKPHPLLASAVRLCAENGVLIVAATGNDGCQCPHVPAAVPSTLAVGAMDAQKLPLKFSNWGDAYKIKHNKVSNHATCLNSIETQLSSIPYHCIIGNYQMKLSRQRSSFYRNFGRIAAPSTVQHR